MKGSLLVPRFLGKVASTYPFLSNALSPEAPSLKRDMKTGFVGHPVRNGSWQYEVVKYG